MGLAQGEKDGSIRSIRLGLRAAETAGDGDDKVFAVADVFRG